jgi:hypothetical protein
MNYSPIIRAQSLVIFGKSKGLAQCASMGFVSSHNEDFFQSCIESCRQISEQIRRIPQDDPETSEARAHLVEMAIGFESMVNCFAEMTDGERSYRPLPEANKIRFSLAANSVIEHYKRLDLAVPE